MLILHERTKQAIDALVTNMPHAVMIVGADGIGKGSIALYIAEQLLGVSEDALIKTAAFKHLMPDEKGTISIESVRQLQQYVKLRTTGTARVRRLILVEHADGMTIESQNAFLKLLEEPPEDTVIILTAAHTTRLLPTIRSRVQSLSVVVPSKDAITSAFKTYPSDRVTQAYFLSGGLPGLMAALLQEDADHPLVASVAQAKQILQEPLFERMLHIEPLSKQKENAILLCQALERIAGAGIAQASAKNDVARLKKWHAIQKESYRALTAFDANANTKLVVSNLLLQL